MEKPLPASARLILRFVARYIRVEGWAPNYKEIMEGTDIRSTSNVAYALDQLEARGLIKHRKREARAIAITAKGQDYLEREHVG